jgi:uncharacterized protein YndB with AHSA1/START domain
MARQFQTEIVVAAPPERVFTALTDFEQARAWMPNLVTITPMSEGPVAVGTRYRETRKMFGRAASETFEVTAFEPPSRLGLRVDGTQGASRKGEYRVAYALEPVGVGTRLSLDSQIEMPGWFFRVFGAVLVRVFRRGIRKDLEALKRHVEAETGTATGAA